MQNMKLLHPTGDFLRIFLFAAHFHSHYKADLSRLPFSIHPLSALLPLLSSDTEFLTFLFN